jgi:hypothetical protein
MADANWGEPRHGPDGRPACERSLNWDGKPPFCGEPADVMTRAMCVHEHCGETYTCWACLSGLRKFCGDSEWECEQCWDGPQPHACPMPMQVTPLTEVA